MKQFFCLKVCFTQIFSTFRCPKPKYSSLLAVLLTMCLYAHAQSPARSGAAALGIVTDSTNVPIEGATVIIKGTNATTITNRDGRFELRSPTPNGVVIASYLGYQSASREFTPNNARSLHLILIPNENMLQEVEVSTGYQTIPKERATGSFVQIDNELLNRRVGTNILDRLDGVTSGLVFNRNNQGSGNETPISIRGRSTLFANPEPLIILDNFPYEGDLASINPNDVESITVLKDAAAASIWGVRAGNGVIVITSKNGRANQKPTIRFNANITMSAKPDLWYAPQLSSTEFIEVEQYLFDKGKYNSTINNGYGALSPAVEIMLKAREGQLSDNEAEAMLETLAEQDVREDLDRYFYRNGLNQQYQLELSGGGTHNDYFISGSLDNNRSQVASDAFHRYTLNARNTYRFFGDRLKLVNGVLFSYTSTEANQRPYRPDNPYDKVADPSGNALPVSDGTLRLSYLDALDDNLGLVDWYYRPLDERKANFNNAGANIRITNSLSYSVFPSLDISANYLYQKTNTDLMRYDDEHSYYTRNQINSLTQVDPETGQLTRPIPLGGIRSLSTGAQTGHTGRIQVSHNRSYFSGQKLHAIVGFEMSSSTAESANTTLYGYDEATASNANGTIDFTENYPYFYRTSNRRIDVGIGNSAFTDRYISYYGNLSYSILGRYVVSGSFRKDESNLFGVKSNQRGVPLWSAGFLYNLSEESFYRIDWLRRLALRATYGYNGNIDKSTAALLTARAVGIGPQWNSFYSTITNPPNPSLRWERIRNLNLGVDFALNNNRVDGSIEYYIKQGIDLIGDSPIAPQTGVASYRGNSAATETKGVDVMINGRILNRPEAFRWSAAFLFNYVKDRVTDFKKERGSNWDIISSNYLNPLVGYPYNSLFAYRWAGLDEEGSPQALLDGATSQDYTGIRNSTAMQNLRFVGSGVPTVFGSLRNTFGWNGLSMSVNITYKTGYYFRRRSLNNSALYNSFAYQQADYGHRWQQPGDEEITNVPALIYPANLNRTNVYVYSDILAERGDHVRLQDISLDYTFNTARLFSGAVKQLKLYLYVNNVGMIWKSNKAGIDPDNRLLPAIRTYAFGLTSTF